MIVSSPPRSGRDGGSPPGRPRLQHVPALDGLRGVALLGVLFFHAGGTLPGGYLGVDLFFVLSGFLITSLLLAEQRDTGRIVLTAFWARRARRLFPALLSLMPAIAVYGRFFAKPDELSALRADALATLGYVANWRAIFAHKSYWELFTAPSPLEHMWSLAIEEQFYVVWPLLVVLVLRRRGNRVLPLLVLALAATSMAAMMALFRPEDTSRAYLGTDTRAAGILAGAALATVISPSTTLGTRAVRALDGLGVVSALGLAVAWCRLPGSSWFLYHGGFWLTEIAVLVLIACAVMGPRGLVARALSLRPLTLIGTVSYGAYLWHWPVDVLLTSTRVHVRGPLLYAVQLAVTFAIAAVSYRFLERPIRQRGLPFGRAIYVVPSAVALSIFLVVRATHARPNGVPLALAPPPLTEVADGQQGDRIFHPAPLRIMVFGDSTANSLGWTLRGVRKPGVLVDLLGKDGCSMLWDECGGAEWAAQAKGAHVEAILVFFGGAFLHGMPVDGEWRKSCHPVVDRKFQSTVTQRLGDLRTGESPVWLATLPYPLGPYDSAPWRAEVDCVNASLRKAAAAVPGVRVLDFAERVCPKGVCVVERDGVQLRPDGVHYDIEGTRDVASWVLEQLQPP